MPLPDERPRASVANLIGRFENQTKRLSLSASAGSPSRSSSVVSHVTEDSGKVEAKEKREWPPKPAGGAERLPIVLPPRQFPPALNTQIANRPVPTVDQEKGDTADNKPKPEEEQEQEVPLTAKALDESQSQIKGDPSEFLENWRKEVPANPEELEAEAPPTAVATVEKPPEAVTPTPSTVRKIPVSSSKQSVTPAKAVSKPASSGPTKVPPSSFPKATAKTPLKPATPRSSLTPSTSQSLTPLKPQLTGQSVSSTSARKTVVRTPVTPSRAKTPTTARTPVTRPKTPSTGLFAPTAASLARSRNAPPSAPTPIKKATLSSDAMDRLSKPTAASLSRAKAPPTSSPSRPTPVRSPAAKPKATTNATKAKQAPGPTTKLAKSAASVSASPSNVAQVGVEGAHEPVQEASARSPSNGSANGEPEPSEGESESQDIAPIATPPVDANDVEPPSQGDVSPHFGQSDEGPTVVVGPSDDLADIVNLLEGHSSSKLSSGSEVASTIPDIPDEDDRH